MSGPGDNALRTAVERHLARVFNFCRRMTLDADDAIEAAYATFARAARGPLPGDEAEHKLRLLQWACDALSPRISPAPEVSFDVLDETLRSEATRTGEVASLTNP